MDRTLKKPIFILLIFIMNFSCATTIDEQIEAIKDAPESERVELMNQFKRQLILMNQEQREKAIDRLKSDRTEQSIQPEMIPPQPDDFINTVQSNNIEQNIQTTRDITIIEEVNLPNIPKVVEPHQGMPESSNPTVPNPIAEPSQGTPTTPNPPTGESQGAPTTPNPTTEPSPNTPTAPNPTAGQSQGTPTTGEPQGTSTPPTPTPSQGTFR